VGRRSPPKPIEVAREIVAGRVGFTHSHVPADKKKIQATQHRMNAA